MEKFKAKSVIVSRRQAAGDNNLYSVMIALYEENNPHLKGREPVKILEYVDLEKVRIRELRNISFYLDGHDLVVNNLVDFSIELDKKKGIITLTGNQEL